MLFRSQGHNRHLCDFIYELEQNSHEHGRFDKDGSLIPGLRYLQMARYYFEKKEHLEAEWNWHSGLLNFAQSKFSREKIRSFLFVTITDLGCGIVDKYLSKYQELGNRDVSRIERRDLLNGILTNVYMTTKSAGSVAAGAGLLNALRAASGIEGFVSLRTDQFRMERDYATARFESGDISLKDSSETGILAKIAGTHWTLVIPLP